MDDTLDPRMAKALSRYQVISAYLALNPKRGEKLKLLEELAGRTWIGPDGEPFTRAAETIRQWLRGYRRNGLQGLMDKQRPRHGVQSLTDQQIELACKLKQEVPERSLERLITIMEALGHVEPGTVRRSTLHRALQARGLSGRKLQVADTKDLDRFEAAFPNDLWQSDMLVGPWLPDPSKPGKVRRAYLYAFLDDHSRLLLYGRFSFKGDLPALELVMRRSLQRFGLPRRCYYDNGMVYRSGHMKQIVATLGLHRIIYTQPYRPMGHGKIEAFNRLVRSAFLSEIKASTITTLDQLNEAFLAWVDGEYNQRIHASTSQTPRDRWRAGIDHIRYADDEMLRLAFQWKERRKADKTGVFSLFGTRYQVGAELCGKYIEVHYDPERLDEIEVWHQDRFIERVRPFEVKTHRRARAVSNEPTVEDEQDDKPVADWLGHLVERRRKQGFIEPDPRQWVDQTRQERAEADDAIVALLFERLDPLVIDESTIRRWLDRFGPLEPEQTAYQLDTYLAQGEPTDQHVVVYLEAIRAAANGGSHD